MTDTNVAAFMPVLNEGGRINKAINSLQEQSCSISKLYVIDGGSTDSTHQEVRDKAEEADFEIELEILEGAGVRYSSQYGAEKASEHISEELGEDEGIILRLEGDSSLEQDFVKQASKKLIEEDYKAFGAVVKPHDPKTKPLTKKLFKFLQNAEMLPKGRGMAFKLQDFKECNGYKMKPDEDIKNSDIDCLEDGILISKLKKQGKIAFSHKTHVKSSIPSTTATSFDRYKKGFLIEKEIGPTWYYSKLLSPVNKITYPIKKNLK